MRAARKDALVPRAHKKEATFGGQKFYMMILLEPKKAKGKTNNIFIVDIVILITVSTHEDCNP